MGGGLGSFRNIMSSIQLGGEEVMEEVMEDMRDLDLTSTLTKQDASTNTENEEVEMEQLRKERDDLERKGETAVAALAKEQEKVVDLLNEVDELKRKKVDTAGGIVVAFVKLKAVEQQLKEVQGKWEKEKVTVTELRGRLETVEERESSLQFRLEEEVILGGEVREKLEEAQKKVGVQEGLLKDATEVAATAQNKVEELVTLNNQLQKRLNNEQEQKSRYQAKFGMLRDAVLRVSEEVTGFTASFGEEEASGSSAGSLGSFVGGKLKELGEIEGALMELVGLAEAKKMVMNISQLIETSPVSSSPKSRRIPPTSAALTTASSTTATSDTDGSQFLEVDTQRCLLVPEENAAHPLISPSLPEAAAYPLGGNSSVEIIEDDGQVYFGFRNDESSDVEDPDEVKMSPGSPLSPSPEHGVDHSKNGHYCLCGRNTATAATLQAHLYYYTSEKIFVCPELNCEERYSGMYYLRRHLLSRHGIATNRQGCRGCGNTFETLDECKDHRILCEGRKLKRSQGSLSYPDQGMFSLSLPSSSKKMEPPPAHAVDTSKQEGPKGHHYCVCGWKARRGDALRRHIVNNTTEPNFPCSECPHRFVYMAQLRRHMWKKHKISSSKRTGCWVCGDTFDSAGALQEHRKLSPSCSMPQRKKRADSTFDGSSGEKPPTRGQDPFLCTCGAKVVNLKSKKSLRKRKLECYICSEKFPAFTLLQGHLANGHKMKGVMFVRNLVGCRICGKVFPKNLTATSKYVNPPQDVQAPPEDPSESSSDGVAPGIDTIGAEVAPLLSL